MGSKRQIFTQDFSGGLVINKLPHKLKDNQSPKMLNMLPFDENGIMMRTGQQYKTAEPVNGKIYNIYQLPYEGFTVFAGYDGTNYKIYCLDNSAETVTYTALYTLSGAGKGTFFEFENILYFLNGTEYIKIYLSGETLTAAAVTGYVPLVYVNGYATGTNFAFVDSFNLLSARYRTRYIPDGTVTVFQLPHKTLDANLSSIKCYYLYPTKTEITAFTASNSSGITKITFTTAPAAFGWYMGGNVLEIEAPYDEVTTATERAKMINCTLAEEYGGSLGGTTSGTRLFITGNGNYPGSVWWSAVMSADYSAAEYFPDINVEIVGDAKKKNIALGKQYNELIVFKERSIHGMAYQFDGTKASFTVREIHGNIGCDMPYTVQLINNDLCFANTYGGVFLMISTNNNNERNVVPISGNVNKSEKISDNIDGILNFPSGSLKSAVSFDDGQRYWLCIAPYVYVWDYSIKAYSNYTDIDTSQNRLSWWLLDNFNALCWVKINGVVHYGSANKLDFVIPNSRYNDFGIRINAYYKTKGYDGGDATIWKNFKQIVFSQKTVGTGQAVLHYTSDALDLDGETVQTQTFSFSDFAFDAFTFAVVNYGDIHSVYPQMEHTAYFAWTIKNGEINTDLFITDVKTIYFPQNGDY